MRKFYPAIVLLLGLSLSGCFSDGSNPNNPPRNTSSTGIGNILGGDFDPDTSFRADFDPTRLAMPYPNDILGFQLFPPTDGTLNLAPLDLQIGVTAVNQLDGFSTFSRLQANFSSGSVDGTSLSPLSVFLLEVALDPSSRATIGLSDETLCKLGLAPRPACPFDPTGNPFLIQGVDYELSVAPDIDANGQTIQLEPLKPLNHFTAQQFTPGAINGYLMILTDGITDTGGTAAVADTTYEQVKQGFLAGIIQLPPPGTPLPPDLTPEEQLGLIIAAHLTIVDALANAGAPIAVEDVIVTASFSPQDTVTVLKTAVALPVVGNRPSQIAQFLLPVDLPLPGGGVIPAGTPVTTGLLRTGSGAPPASTKDNGNIYMGGISIPYFQEPPTDESGGYNVLTSTWVAEAGKNVLGDPDSTIISRWNPEPVQQADITIPLLMAIPNANSAWVQAAQGQGIPVPLPTGWPVVVYQPGFSRSRTDLIAVAEPWLDRGFAVISIDLPFHGITVTDPAESLLAILRVPGTTERTFDLDLRNNENPVDATPDGIIDESSTNFLSPLPDGILTFRDNGREAVVTMLALRRSLGSMDIDADSGTTDLDGSRVEFVGHSGGGILAGIMLGVSDEFASASLPSTGAGLVKLLEESDVEEGFGFIIEGLKAGLAAGGFPPGGAVYNNYLRDFQHVLNEGDPISYGREAAQSATPIFVNFVNTDPTVTAAAALRFVNAFGLPQITTPGPNFTSRGYTRILLGNHRTFLSPEVSLEATTEMQTEVAVFLGGSALAGLPGDGQVILIADPTVVETN